MKAATKIIVAPFGQRLVLVVCRTIGKLDG